MKTSTSQEFYLPNASTISFRSLSVNDLDDLLLPFYLGLDFDTRRARFDCAVSDDSITRHCHGLDFDEAIVLGCLAPIGLIAAIELHSLSSDWDYVEFAFAISATKDRIMILGHLLQLAAFAVGKRGCNTLLVPMEFPDREMLDLLRSMGRVCFQSDSAFVDLDEYARLHSPSVVRS
jgi:hypothetical protein